MTDIPVVTDWQIIGDDTLLSVFARTDTPTHLWLIQDCQHLGRRPRFKYRRGVGINCGWTYHWPSPSCQEQDQPAVSLLHTWTLHPTCSPALPTIALANDCNPYAATWTTAPLDLNLHPPTPPASLILDTFTRPDALACTAGNLGNTEVPGVPWLIYTFQEGGPSNLCAIDGIQNNAFIEVYDTCSCPYPQSDSTPLLVVPDFDFPNGDYRVAVSNIDHLDYCPADPGNDGQPNDPFGMGPAARITSPLDFFLAEPTGGSVYLWRVEAGTYTMLDFYNGIPTSNYTIELRCLADQLQVWQTAPGIPTLLITATDTFNQTATRVGIRTGSYIGCACSLFIAQP